MIRHILYGVRNAAIGFTAGVFVYVSVVSVWWSFYPYETAEVVTPIQILNANKEVRPGEDILMLVKFDKRTNITPTVSRNVICDSGAVLGVPVVTNGGNSRPQGKFVTEVQFTLDTKALLGDVCVFQFQNDYQVNPIRIVRKVWQSEPFKVIE